MIVLIFHKHGVCILCMRMWILMKRKNIQRGKNMLNRWDWMQPMLNFEHSFEQSCKRKPLYILFSFIYYSKGNALFSQILLQKEKYRSTSESRMNISHFILHFIDIINFNTEKFNHCYGIFSFAIIAFPLKPNKKISDNVIMVFHLTHVISNLFDALCMSRQISVCIGIYEHHIESLSDFDTDTVSYGIL